MAEATRTGVCAQSDELCAKVYLPRLRCSAMRNISAGQPTTTVA